MLIFKVYKEDENSDDNPQEELVNDIPSTWVHLKMQEILSLEKV